MAPKSSSFDAARPRTPLSCRCTLPRTLHAQSCTSASDQSPHIHRRAGLLVQHGWSGGGHPPRGASQRQTTALGARSPGAEAVPSFRRPRRASARAGSATIAHLLQSLERASVLPVMRSLLQHLQVLRQVDGLDCSVRTPMSRCRTASPAYSIRVAALGCGPLPCGPLSRRRASSASRRHVASCAAGLRRSGGSEYGRLRMASNPVDRRSSLPRPRRSLRR